MRALVYHGPGDIRCDSVADPDPIDVNGAVVEVTAAGICGSDLHIYEGHGFVPTAGYTVGHEAVGVVVEAGSGVRGFRTGDRVLVSAGAGCGMCSGCRAGQLLDCEVGAAIFGIGLGLVRRGGTVSVVGVPFSEKLSYPLRQAFGRNVTFRIGLADVHGAWPALVPLVRSGRLRPERVVTTDMALSDGAEAYARYLAREGGVMKISLDPSR